MFAHLLCRSSRTSTHDLPQLARFLHRTLLSRNAASSPAVRTISRASSSRLVQLRRSYATTTSRAKPTTAAKKPATKKQTAAKHKKKATAKKKAAPKPKRVKKVLTAEAKEKQLLSELKKKALKPPVTPTPANTWAIFLGEAQQAAAGKEGRSLTEITKEAAAKYKSLSPAEKEHYNHLRNEAGEAKKKEFRDWVHSHTPEEIRIANLARNQLKLKFKDKVNIRRLRKIQDDRAPKKPPPAYASFFADRIGSGDFNSISVRDRAKLIAQEWKTLSADEKRKYEDKAEEDNQAYKRQFKDVMGHELGA